MANPEARAYNVLLFGETQAGKSTLIEALRKYADSHYVIDRDLLGNGIVSKTADVKKFVISTNLPSYSLSKGDEHIDPGSFLDEEDPEDYEDELNDRKTYKLRREEADGVYSIFNLVDTPGMNDTSKFDESNLAVIFESFKNISSINLVVIAIANTPLTEGLSDAIKAYIDLVPQLRDNVVFLHTNVDYAKCHHTDVQFFRGMEEKKKILQKLIGRNSVPHLLIDNDADSSRTVRMCITQNALRSLLGMAKLNQPIPVQAMVFQKTEKMLQVDYVIRTQYEDDVKKLEFMLQQKGEEQSSLLIEICSHKAAISRHQHEIKSLRREIVLNSRDDLVLLHEQVYQQDFSIMGLLENKKVMYYPGKVRSSQPGFVHHEIDHIDIRNQNMIIHKKSGGVGQKHWAAEFIHKKVHSGSFHIRIYVTKRKMYGNMLMVKHTRLYTSEGELEERITKLQEIEERTVDLHGKIDELIDDLKQCLYVLTHVMSTTLDNNIFQMMIENKVYVRDIAESAKKVIAFYIDNRHQLEAMERATEQYINPPPVNTSEQLDIGGAVANVEVEKQNLQEEVEREKLQEERELEKQKLQEEAEEKEKLEEKMRNLKLEELESLEVVKKLEHPSVDHAGLQLVETTEPHQGMGSRLRDDMHQAPESMKEDLNKLPADTVKADNHEEDKSSNPQDSPPRTILLLGATQVGKSALLEGIKKYFDPNYAIDESSLGNGFVSKTDRLQMCDISSVFPIYE
ncbi:hypothetical protein BG004_007035, partial [Podila humilis]